MNGTVDTAACTPNTLDSVFSDNQSRSNGSSSVSPDSRYSYTPTESLDSYTTSKALPLENCFFADGVDAELARMANDLTQEEDLSRGVTSQPAMAVSATIPEPLSKPTPLLLPSFISSYLSEFPADNAPSTNDKASQNFSTQINSSIPGAIFHNNHDVVGPAVPCCDQSVQRDPKLHADGIPVTLKLQNATVVKSLKRTLSNQGDANPLKRSCRHPYSGKEEPTKATDDEKVLKPTQHNTTKLIEHDGGLEKCFFVLKQNYLSLCSEYNNLLTDYNDTQGEKKRLKAQNMELKGLMDGLLHELNVLRSQKRRENRNVSNGILSEKLLIDMNADS